MISTKLVCLRTRFLASYLARRGIKFQDKKNLHNSELLALFAPNDVVSIINYAFEVQYMRLVHRDKHSVEDEDKMGAEEMRETTARIKNNNTRGFGRTST